MQLCVCTYDEDAVVHDRERDDAAERHVSHPKRRLAPVPGEDGGLHAGDDDAVG